MTNPYLSRGVYFAPHFGSAGEEIAFGITSDRRRIIEARIFSPDEAVHVVEIMRRMLDEDDPLAPTLRVLD